MTYENIIIEQKDKVLVVQLNRPQAMNALATGLLTELNEVLEAAETNDDVRVVLITGSEKAFAAGADIKEMASHSFATAYKTDFITKTWERLTKFRKPTIAAVSGFALGGGCELAMMCDIIIAADNAKFGQPEISLGIIPGAGGTQRLTKAIGKAKAMEMILTGRMMKADEAEAAGLVAKVVPLAELQTAALEMANKIATFSAPAVMLAKEAVNAAFNHTLCDGVKFERRLFYSTFALEDQKEGMAAFTEKRPAVFKDQ